MDERPRTELLNRLNRRVVQFAVVAVCVLLVVIDIMVWRVLEYTHRSALEDTHRAAVHEMERRLAAEVIRLEVIGRLPATDAVLGAGARAAATLPRRPSADVINRDWAGYARDEMPVREVLDNTVAEMLRHVCEDRPVVQRLFLTDAAGAVLAASDKPPLHDYSNEAWWKEVSGRPLTGVTSDGFGERFIGLALPLRGPGGGTALRGILKEELNVDELMKGLQAGADSNHAAVLLIGRGVRMAAGSHAVFERVSPELVSRFSLGERGRGWSRGFRFISQWLGAGISWSSPVWIVTIRQESFLPPTLYGSVAGVVLISVLLALGWNGLCRWYFNRLITAPHMEMLEAGDWILRTAMGRHTALSAPAAPGTTRNIIPEASPLQRQLQKWLRDLLQNLQDEHISQTYEMQRDLNLARDFQRAYIDRAYPKIPAVHVEGRLRLDFYHHYEPALALGGDFYNILTLAADSAGVFIADVMGHGTRSALITAIIRTLIDDLAPQGRNARHFVTEMNKLFCGLLRSVPNPLFASAFYFVADTTARVGTFSSAGHPAPFHIRRSVGRVTRLEVPMPRGVALGLLPNETYTGGYCRLIDGDVFVFFTDGVYEARNVHGEEFGIVRMEQTLRELMYKNAKDLVEGLMDAISRFVGYEPLSDDLCVVAVEVTTKPPVS